MQQKTKRDRILFTMSRREFLRYAGTAATAYGALGAATLGCSDDEDGTVGKDAGPVELDDPTVVEAFAVSQGYLLVDTKKCQGCMSCMLACSLVNEGVESLSLARLQVIQNPFEKWPDDLTIEQCRQCADAPCVAACTFDALRVDEAHGNVRVIDEESCVGCGQCVQACPYVPTRPVMARDGNVDNINKSRKCDLCANAPYHWADEGGGPGGKQACVEACTIRAVVFTETLPVQEGDEGYKVNLRDNTWGQLGYPRN